MLYYHKRDSLETETFRFAMVIVQDSTQCLHACTIVTFNTFKPIQFCLVSYQDNPYKLHAKRLHDHLDRTIYEKWSNSVKLFDSRACYWKVQDLQNRLGNRSITNNHLCLSAANQKAVFIISSDGPFTITIKLNENV